MQNSEAHYNSQGFMVSEICPEDAANSISEEVGTQNSEAISPPSGFIGPKDQNTGTITMFFMQICGELNYVSSPLSWIIIVVSSFDSNMCKEFKNAFSYYTPIDLSTIIFCKY